MELKKTALNPYHHELRARMIPFAGWEMPLQYTSIIEEHLSVRRAAGIFDVSHMGQIVVKGKDASPFLQKLSCNNINALKPGAVQYNVFTNEEGGVIDDVTVYCISGEEYFIVSNAANHETDCLHIANQQKSSGAQVEICNENAKWHLLALQGPESVRIVENLLQPSLKELPYFHFTEIEQEGSTLRVSRTGYSGEDGFEIYSDIPSGIRLWKYLLAEGGKWGLLPAGLGARDSLRLEAFYPLHGHELRTDRTPIESGLDWIVKEKKPPFPGQEKILRQKQEGPPGRVVGFHLEEGGLAREGYAVWDATGREIIGHVLSGGYSPILKRGIGSVYLPLHLIEADRPIFVEVREKLLAARLQLGPFVRGGAGKQTKNKNS